jgi:endoglucanase
MPKFSALFIALAILLMQATVAPLVVAATPETSDAFAFNKRLGVGVNLGNALDAPKEGDWGVTLDSKYFALIKQGGFSHVRIPVRWETHCQEVAPYSIDAAFMDRVDWAVRQASANGLAVVLNMHHHEAFEKDPDGQKLRYLAMWKQIAEHFKSAPQTVAFELYNEPAKSFSDSKWNLFAADALHVVRQSNPGRTVVIGPVNWNSIDALKGLVLPADNNLIVTVHYYSPFHFTHQGAEWIGAESNAWLGRKWTAAPDEESQIAVDFLKAKAYGLDHHVPIYLGEFGAYSKADMESRALWTEAVRKQAASDGFSCSYWEFCSGFGIYDAAAKQWRKPLIDALISK